MRTKPFSEIQADLRKIVDDLQAVDDRLAVLSEWLPEPTAGYNVMGLLREALDCVRIELLSDAVRTLDCAARQKPEMFLREYRERLRRLEGIW